MRCLGLHVARLLSIKPLVGCRHAVFLLLAACLLLAVCLLLGKGQKYEDVPSVVRAHPLRLIKKLVSKTY